MENEINTNEPVQTPESKSGSLSSDKQYRSGKILYDVGLAIFTLFLAASCILFFTKTEILIGGMFCTNLIYFMYLIPCLMMVIGLLKQKKAAERFSTTEKGTKTFIVLMSAIFFIMLVLGTVNIFHPSYHVYTVEETKATDGRVFTAVRNEKISIFDTMHDKMPSYYDLDIYDVNGIFARRLLSVYTHQGKYTVDYSIEKGYRLVTTYLGTQETHPFNA